MSTSRRLPLAERFWPKVRTAGPDECWDWTGAATPSGYGYLRATRASSLGPKVPAIVAPRVSWIIHNGPIPDGMGICHTCDRPICVNPAHLFLGTRADNNRDRIAKGRDGERYMQGQRKGFANPNARLTPEQVREIRDRYAAGGVTQVALAEQYGIKQPHISRIVRGVNYLTD